MKKFLCLLLSFVMVLSIFTACGDDKKTDGSDAVANTEKDVNIFTDELVIADKLSAAIDEAKNGSVATVKLGFVFESSDDITEGDAEFLNILKEFGCTGEKIELAGEISLLTTADDKGKIKFTIRGGNDKELLALEALIIGNDIYFDISGVIKAIETLASIGGVSEDELEYTKDMINTLVENKKYIQMNLVATSSMLEELMPAQSGTSVAFNNPELEKAIEDAVKAISEDKTIISALEAAFEEINIMTASDNSLTIKITEKELIEAIDAFAKVIDDNSALIGNIALDFILDAMAAGGATEEDYPTDAQKKEFLDEIANIYDYWSEEKSGFVSEFDDLGFKVEFKLNIDENNDSFFDASLDVSAYEKPESSNKISVNSAFSIKASSETVSDISASECIALETLYAKIMSMYESEVEIETDDEYYNDYTDIYDDQDYAF